MFGALNDVQAAFLKEQVLSYSPTWTITCSFALLQVLLHQMSSLKIKINDRAFFVMAPISAGLNESDGAPQLLLSES